MALDEAIATSVRNHESPPTLRLYGWDRPSLSLGSFQKSSSVDLEYCRENSMPVVRRPTGGRAILHGDELTYSFSVRTDHGPFAKGLLESYRNISSAFSLAFRKIGLSVESKDRREDGRVLTRSPLCFRSSSYGEILIENRKVVGSAQKRWKDGLLQQGSIPFSFDTKSMRHVFGPDSCSRTGDYMAALREIMKDFDEEVFKRSIREAFEETFSVSLPASQPTEAEYLLAQELEERKYLQDSWNLRL
jgi:lipoate-protein ligase A